VNLLQAFQDVGDPQLPVALGVCELMLMVVSAQVKMLPGFDFTMVTPQIRATLLDTFSFSRQELAQSVPLSRVIAAIQNVNGVQYVIIQVFDSISESDTVSVDALHAKLAEISSSKAPKLKIDVPSASLDTATGKLLPAGVAFLSPDLPDTIILTEISL
jgi:hypothetical protein